MYYEEVKSYTIFSFETVPSLISVTADVTFQYQFTNHANKWNVEAKRHKLNIPNGIKVSRSPTEK